jgi:tRNA A-37 threonylcarbamoyl transferase component Bud32
MKICPECLERVDDSHERCPDDGTELRTIHVRDQDPMEGRILEDKWVLESRIGGGGMGTVYRAHQLSVDRTVAVKVLRSALCEDDEHVERFFREANIASNIDDPRCVTIHDFGQTEQDRVLYLAMEYLEGESLYDRMEGEPLTLGEALEVGIQISRALGVLHEQGIVHRDLKPENVCLVGEIGDDVSLKLLDFGLAKHTRSDETPVTATGEIFGTPTFMSPEQCMGAELGPASDLYAFGCLMYELVAGRPPFEGSSSVETLLAHVNRRPPPLEDPVPGGLADLVERLLAKDPGERPGSAEAVRRELEAIAADLDADVATRVGAAERESVARASTRGIEETRDGVVPAPKIGGDDDLALGSRNRDRGAERARPTEERESGTPGVRLGVALLVVVAGFAAVWAFVERSTRTAAEKSRASAVVSVFADGLADSAPVRERIERDVADATRGLPQVPARLAAGAARLAERLEEREEKAAPEPPAPKPSEPSREPDVFPLLTETSATRVFRSKNSVIETCFEKAAGSSDFSGGSFQLRVVVDGSGEVDHASIESSTIDDERVHECATSRASDWTFPSPPERNTVVLVHQYTYELERMDR